MLVNSGRNINRDMAFSAFPTVGMRAVGGGGIPFRIVLGVERREMATSAGPLLRVARRGRGSRRPMTTLKHEYSKHWSRKEVGGTAILALAASGTVLAASSSGSSSSDSGLGYSFSFFGQGGAGGGGPSPGKFFSSLFIAAPLVDEVLPGTKEDSSEQPIPGSLDVSTRALKGRRRNMEDQFFVGEGGRVAAVFDGHGGGDVSLYLREQFFGRLQKHLRRKQWEDQDVPSSTYTPTLSSHVSALRSALDDIESEVVADEKFEYQGSTAVVVTIHETGKEPVQQQQQEQQQQRRTLVTANLGDSRATLSRNRKALDLTRDHKPHDERERARITAMGETVEWDNYAKVHRVKDLSVSRAIGDRDAKPYVSGEAEIMHYPVAEDSDEFVIIATDGLWDVFTSQEAVTFVHKCMNMAPPAGFSTDDIGRLKYTRRKNMSRYLANEAFKRRSGDNICVVVVWLQPLDFKPSCTP
uniref:PPM-type phosphatase domain-containing protein n=1 Tax=Cyclophora tenuis TaxID=216820 RepID=A0A7S1D348_CYCTE